MRKYLLALALGALARGFLYAGIADVDSLMEVLWFEEAVTEEAVTEAQTGWSGDGLTYNGSALEIDAESPVSFTPAQQTGVAVRQVLDIDANPVSELPAEVDSEVQTAFAMTEDMVLHAWGKETKDSTSAEWIAMGERGTGAIALEIDYATTPATIRYYQGETLLGTVYSATTATKVSRYDFIGSGTISSLTGRQTADVAVIVEGAEGAKTKYTAEMFTAQVLADAIAAGSPIKVIASDFTAPTGYEIDENGYLVAESYMVAAKVSDINAAEEKTLKLDDGAILTVDAEPTAAITIDVKEGGTIAVVGDANKFDISKITINGAATFESVTKVYDNAYPTDTELLKNGEAWKNCVAWIKNVQAAASGSGTDLREYGNASSTIRLSNAKFWLTRGITTEATVELVNEGDAPALTIDGTSQNTYTFKALAGNGSLKVTGANSCSFVVEDVSGFAGSIETDKPIYLAAMSSVDWASTGKIIIPAETSVTVADGKTFKAATIQVDGTLTTGTDAKIEGAAAGEGLVVVKTWFNTASTAFNAEGWAGTVDVTSQTLSYDKWYNTYGHEGSTIRIGAYGNHTEGHFDAKDLTVGATLELTGDVVVHNGYSGSKTTLNGITGSGNFTLETDLGDVYTIQINSLEGYTGALTLANKSKLVLPNGEVAVAGAKAKLVGETMSTYFARWDDAVAAVEQTGTTATGIVVLDENVTIPAGYALAEDGTLLRKLYWNGNTGANTHIDWTGSTLSGANFVDANDAAIAYTEGDTIILKTTGKAIYLHDDATNLKFEVVDGVNVRFVRPGSTYKYVLEGIDLTIDEGATVTIPRRQTSSSSGWDTYERNPQQSEIVNSTVKGEGTLVVETCTDRTGAVMVLDNSTVAETVTVKIEDGATIVVKANSTMPEPVLAAEYEGKVLKTVVSEGVTTYTVAAPLLPTATVTEMETEEMPEDPALDAAFVFTPGEYAEDYASWRADFEVTFDGDITDGTVKLYGQYGTYPWTGFALDAMKAGDKVYLMSRYDANLTYAEVVNNVRSFACGVVNTDKANENVKMTVKLVLFNPDDETDTLEITSKTSPLVEPAPEGPSVVEGQGSLEQQADGSYVLTPEAGVTEVTVENATADDVIVVSVATDLTIKGAATVKVMANGCDITDYVVGGTDAFSTALDETKVTPAYTDEVEDGVAPIAIAESASVSVKAIPGLTYGLLRGTQVTAIGSTPVATAVAAAGETTVTLVDPSPAAKSAFYKITVSK